MISEVKRFLSSYQIDGTVRAIFLQSTKGDIFSKGTDYASNKIKKSLGSKPIIS
jgi:hypothetical protein